MEFTCVCVAGKINLARAARLFGLRDGSGWRDRLTVGPHSLNNLLRSRSQDRRLTLFRTGCVVFQDFSSAELLFILKFLEQNLGGVDYQSIVEHRDSFSTEDLGLDGREHRLFLMDAAPQYLAQSVDLGVISQQLDELFIREEVLLERLRRGKNWLNLRFTSFTRRKLIAFQFKALTHLHRMDGGQLLVDGKHAEVCRKLYGHLGLRQRTEAFQSKLNHLNDLLSEFSDNRLETTMINFYWFEVVLLSIFPLLHFVPERPDLSAAFETAVRFLRGLF
jgi:hypothetical protein